jgi:hypothetical protein
MTSSLTHSVRLSCDQLEPRDNPAGNVTAVILPNGYLYVRGDAADNLFSIQQNAAGDLYVFGRSGTTVNGLGWVYLGRGNLTGVSVIADAGNDLAEMIGVRASDLIYTQMGNENDGVAMYGCTAGRMSLQMEGGDDIVAMDGVYVGGYAEVLGGSGFDTIDYRTYAIGAGFYYTDVERQIGGGYGY